MAKKAFTGVLPPSSGDLLTIKDDDVRRIIESQQNLIAELYQSLRQLELKQREMESTIQTIQSGRPQ
jgi:hypothetical protein